MIHVFHVITTINRGGAENQLLVLAKQQVILGFQVHIVFLKGQPELEQDYIEIGAQVHHEIASKAPFFQPFALRKIIEYENAIVHAHLPRAELISLFTPKKFKFFVSRHNSEPFFPGKSALLSKALSNLVELRTSKIIAISEAVRSYLIDHKEIRNQEKIEVVLYGYEPHFSRDVTRKKKSIAVKHIGTISRLADQKDIPTMLTMLKQIQSEKPEVQLTILGAGPLESYLKDLTSNMNLESSVSFIGRSSDVYAYLSTLDVFVLTSKYEGFGMVLLEAMDAGIPIVASRNSAIPEVLGVDFPGLCLTGVATDFVEKVRCLEDTQYRNSILDIQEERLRIFSSRKMAEKITCLYLMDL